MIPNLTRLDGVARSTVMPKRQLHRKRQIRHVSETTRNLS